MLWKKIINKIFEKKQKLEKDKKKKYLSCLKEIEDGYFYIFKKTGKYNFAIDRDKQVVLRINGKWRFEKFLEMSKDFPGLYDIILQKTKTAYEKSQDDFNKDFNNK